MFIAVPPQPRAGTLELLAQQREYLLTLASHVKEVASGRTTLDDAAKKEIETRMTARYPNAGLPWLIPMNVEPIARELDHGSRMGDS